MCGIAGILLFSDERCEVQTALGKMARAIEHRGPDDQGIFLSTDQRVGLAHARLSIIDLSSAGHQPMTSSDGRYTIIFNGEIYNFPALRQQLSQAGEGFVSHSDTEVILKLYARYGNTCVNYLRGMFAFAVWDNERRELFLTRDRLGIKPLYYHIDARRVVFASEVRAIISSGLVTPRIDQVALSDFLTYQSVPAPRTLVEGIQTLLPGHWMKVNRTGEVSSGEYWNLLHNRSEAAAMATKSEALHRVSELLREAIAMHLISDVPLGVFLSGGIDSSVLVALMRELGHTPQTFSVVFGESSYDESGHARQIAQRFQTAHTEIRLSDQAMLEQLPAALAAQDQPTGDGVNTYIVSKAVKGAGITVALSGLGGDEFFAGYPSFQMLSKMARYLPRLNYFPRGLFDLGDSALRMLGKESVRLNKALALLKSDGSVAEMYPVIRQVLSPAQRQKLFDSRWRAEVMGKSDPYVDLLRTAFGANGKSETLARISYAEGRTYMHDVLLRDTDQMSMAHALEARVPLLDHVLVEYLMGLPDKFKYDPQTPKSLLVESLQGLLPDEVVHRPKQGFVLPFAVWMRHGLRAFCEERLQPERIRARGIFDAGQVQLLWSSFLNGARSVSWSRLWVLVALEEWLERNQITTMSNC